MAPSVFFYFKTLRPTSKRERLFLEVMPTKGLHDLCGRKFAGKVTQKPFGQVWENSGKNPSHPQTFACSSTYGLDNSQINHRLNFWKSA